MNSLVTAALMALVAYAGVFVVLSFLVLCIFGLRLLSIYGAEKPRQ